MKRIAFSLLSVVMLIVMALPVASIPVLPAGSVSVLAQPSSWPNNTQWTPPSDCYCDPQDQPHGESYLDLVGNDTIGPAAYYYFGTDYAFFRERVEGDPSGHPSKFAQAVWVVLFDLPEAGNYEYLLSLNGKNETVELWENTVKKYLIWNPILKDPAEDIVWSNSTADYARIVADETGHYFVDWAIPLTDLPTNITASTKMYFCTSADANNYNKDYLDCYGPDLAITEKSEAWVSLANKTYNVSYTVCNEGAAAPAGASNTTITIDGVPVLEDPVPGLAAGVCYNSTVGPFTMSGTNDTIMVCADNGGVVAESNETNNCMENIIACELPVANFTADHTSGCAPLNVTFTDLSTPIGEILSWSWDFGDGSNSTLQNPSHQYSAGNYTVSLNVTNACGSDNMTKIDYITVKPAPVANFTASDQNPCVNTPILFTDSSTGNLTSWTWNFPGGTPSNATGVGPQTVTYSSAGTYTVNLTVTNACGNDTESKTNYITVNPAPQADFSANNTNPCVNTPILFTDSSTGNLTSWTWNFPGGTPSNATGVGPQTVTYSSAGNYTVSLTVTNECGNDTETKTNYITVKAAPVADFTASDQNPCVNTDVNFTDLSTPSDNIDSWSWDFGDGSNSTAQNPTHQYSSAGNYTVSLTVTNECGNDTETKSEYITVKPAPQANFSANNTNPCVNTPILFTDSSTGNPTSWSWNFPGGSPTSATGVGPHTVTYSAAGNYTVSLTVSNACGNDTESKLNFITVKAPPVAAFSATPTTGYAPLTVNFTDLSTPTGEILTWSWDFGDGSNSTDQNPSHQYTAIGTYTVSLTVSNACGSNTTSAPVIVTARPTPGGGGGGGGTCYLDIDMLGKITRVRISCVTSRTLESKVAPDFNNTNFLEIDLGTQVLCDDLGRRPEVLVMRLANETPPVPDGSALVSPVYNFTGNYSSISCGYRNALQCCSGVTFDQNITLVLNYDPNELPEFTASLAMAYYDTEQGIWVGLPPDIGRVAEIGKSTGLINHFSTVAIIAELAPPPAPASFVASTLNIEQSPLVWKNIFVGVTGEDVTITANVANNGGQEGTYTAELKLNGKTVDTKEVTLAAGQSQQVSFTVSGMDYGQYEVEVAGLSGEFTVSRSIAWWLIIGIILAVGVITWAAIWWRKRKKKAAQSE